MPPFVLESFDDMRRALTTLTSTCQWKSAAELCERYLQDSEPETKSAVLELLADCRYASAFQEIDRDSFKKTMLLSAQAYEKAASNNDDENNPQVSTLCRARANFACYWATDDPVERRKLILDQSVYPLKLLTDNLANAATPSKYENRIYCNLLEYILISFQAVSDKRQLSELVRDGKRIGRKALARFKSETDPKELIEIANAYTSFLYWIAGTFLDEQESLELSEEIFSLSEKVLSLTDQLAESETYFRSLALESASHIAVEFKADFKEGIRLLRRSLDLAQNTKDHYLIGRLLGFLSFTLVWQSVSLDVPEEKKEILQEAHRAGLKSIDELKIPLATSGWLTLSFELVIQSLVEQASAAEKKSEKSDLLDAAIKLGREGIGYAVYSPLEFVDRRLTNVLCSRARLESDPHYRDALLTESSSVIDAFLSRVENLVELNSWNIAIAFWAAGMAKSELAKDQKKPLEERSKLLHEATADLKKARDLSSMSSASASGRESHIARICELLGDSYFELYELSSRKEDSAASIKAYENSISYYEKVGQIGYVAFLSWKTARQLDLISSYEESSAFFLKASEAYQSAAKSQKGFHVAFLDLSSYLRAWSQIEQARKLHLEEKYQLASEKLGSSATILLETESYRALSKHYEAYSKAEEAEELSRSEEMDEAASIFQEASELFDLARGELAAATTLGVRSVLRGAGEDLKLWVDLSATRAKYCLGRKAMDEAKSLDKKGEAEASMEKYRQAAQTFLQLEERGKDASELEALALSCQAFAAMKEAEIASSSDLYSKASEFFLLAREKKVRKSFAVACVANSCICKALEVGARFKESSEAALYSEIKRQLGAATRYYGEAGLLRASDWTRATETLFDAFAYLAGAEAEFDPARKNQLYLLAEKYLELSARRYAAIGYDKKKEEVLKHLEAVRENKDLLISPLEALSQVPAAAPSPVSFEKDQAVGLEHFEVANVTGNISLSEKSVHFGTSVRLDIELANIGKATALLVRIENLVPEGSFNFDSEKNPHRFQVSEEYVTVDLKGRKLEYMKSHELSLFLSPKKRGDYTIKPRLVFVDELGKYKTFEFAPLNLEVKELGLMGWAKGKH